MDRSAFSPGGRGSRASPAWLAGCVLLACHAPRAPIAPGLVVPYAYELEAAEPSDAPFVADFASAGRELVFVAAHHENRRDSRTFRLIDGVFDQHRIAAVIIEGVPTSLGTDPPQLLARFEESVRDDFYPMGEASYAALAARAHGATVVGGEPDEAEVRRAVLAEGFDDRDLAGFYFVRQVPQYRRQGELEAADLATLYAELLAYYRQVVGLILEDGSFEAFLDWYRVANGKPFDLDTFDPEEAAPVDGPYRTQDVSQAVGLVRDRHVAALIERTLESGSPVLIVFGKSHLPCLRPALEASLGPPRTTVP